MLVQALRMAVGRLEKPSGRLRRTPDERSKTPLIKQKQNRKYNMLETIVVILLILWLLGLVTSYTMGGFVHILLVVAVVMALVRIIQGKRVL